MCHSTFQTIKKYYQPSDTRVTHLRGKRTLDENHLTRMCAQSSISESYDSGFRYIETTRRDYKYMYVYTCIYIYNFPYNNELSVWLKHRTRGGEAVRIGRSIET